MTDTTVFRRTSRQLLLTIFSALMLTAAAYLNFLDWQLGGRGLPLLMSVVFGIWAVLVWLNVIRRQTYGHVGPDGIFVRRPLREFMIPWDALVWAKIDADVRVATLAYQMPGEERLRYTGFVAKTIGREGVTALRDGIARHRPDLPTQPPETV